MKKILSFVCMLAITATAFSQNCLVVTSASFSNPSNDNVTFTLTINYTANGNKALETFIAVGSNQNYQYYCLVTNGSGQVVYPGIISPFGITAIMATFVPHTGTCGSAACGPTKLVIGGGPLAVKLSAFTTTRVKDLVNIAWETVSEERNKNFVVQRADKNDFRDVAVIAAGNLPNGQKYSYTDRNDNSGLTQYRLKIVDLDGGFTYSPIKTVNGVSGDLVSVFPNPAYSNSKITVSGVADNSYLQIMDISGKAVRTVATNATGSVDLTGLQAGTYFIRIVNKATGEITSKKMSVIN